MSRGRNGQIGRALEVGAAAAGISAVSPMPPPIFQPPAPILRVYVAAWWGARERARAVFALLEAEGIAVTSRWLHNPPPPGWGPGDSAQIARKAAEIDLADIDAAQGVLSLTEDPTSGYQTGGRHVEFGYALARGKWLWLVGPSENVFHAGVSRVFRFATVEEWIRFATGRPYRMPAGAVAWGVAR